MGVRKGDGERCRSLSHREKGIRANEQNGSGALLHYSFHENLNNKFISKQFSVPPPYRASGAAAAGAADWLVSQTIVTNRNEPHSCRSLWLSRSGRPIVYSNRPTGPHQSHFLGAAAGLAAGTRVAIPYLTSQIQGHTGKDETGSSSRSRSAPGSASCPCSLSLSAAVAAPPRPCAPLDRHQKVVMPPRKAPTTISTKSVATPLPPCASRRSMNMGSMDPPALEPGPPARLLACFGPFPLSGWCPCIMVV